MERMQYSVLLLVLLMATLEIIKAYPYRGGQGNQNAGGPSRHPTQLVRPAPYGNPSRAVPSHQGSVPTMFDLNMGVKEFIAKHLSQPSYDELKLISTTEIYAKITGTAIRALLEAPQPTTLNDLYITTEQIQNVMRSATNNPLLAAMNTIASGNNGRIQLKQLTQLLRQEGYLVAGLELYVPRGGWITSNVGLIIPNGVDDKWRKDLVKLFKRKNFTTRLLAEYLLKDDLGFRVE